MRFIKGALKGLLGFVIFLLVIGVSYQKLSYWYDQSRYSPPGKLVDVGNNYMHLDCTGGDKHESSLTVVLEPGFSMSGIGWARIQGHLDDSWRVCSYDRPGFGWSDPVDEPLDGLHIAQRLHALLDNAGEKGPYILIGHSMGALFAQVFAKEYPEDVEALVLIDPPANDLLSEEERGAFLLAHNRFQSSLKLMSIGVHLGLTRIDENVWKSKAALPKRELDFLKAHYGRPDHVESMYRQSLSYIDTMKQTGKGSALKGVPVLTLSAENDIANYKVFGITHERHKSLSEMSAMGQHVIVPESDHISLVLGERVSPVTAQLIGDWLNSLKKPISILR